MRRTGATLLCAAVACLFGHGVPPAAAANQPAPPDGEPATTAPITPSTTPSPTPSSFVASEPLVPIPQGCPQPPIASTVFVGRVVAKDHRTARFQVHQVRAGTTAGYQLGTLIDVRYGNDVEYLEVDEVYLVGAVPQGLDLALTSKVRADEPLLGGDAVVGLTDRAGECPVVEDPVRTFHVDGSEIKTSLLSALSSEKDQIAMAFVRPLAVAFAIVLGLVLVRWLLSLVVLAARRAAENERTVMVPRE